MSELPFYIMYTGFSLFEENKSALESKNQQGLHQDSLG